jgi:protein TonB
MTSIVSSPSGTVPIDIRARRIAPLAVVAVHGVLGAWLLAPGNPVAPSPAPAAIAVTLLIGEPASDRSGPVPVLQEPVPPVIPPRPQPSRRPAPPTVRPPAPQVRQPAAPAPQPIAVTSSEDRPATEPAPLPDAPAETPPPRAATPPAATDPRPQADVGQPRASTDAPAASGDRAAAAPKTAEPAAPAIRTVSIGSVSYLSPPILEYPIGSRRNREEGQALVSVRVDTAGLPTQVRLERSSGHPRLDESALATARATRFRPYTENGEPRPFRVVMPLIFELEN